MIKPTVGRKVWYRPSANDKAGQEGMRHYGDAPLDATVVCVHSDRLVNLVIFDQNGNLFKRTSVRLLQDDDVPHVDAEGNNTGFYVEWMPYQTKVAAKEEAA